MMDLKIPDGSYMKSPLVSVILPTFNRAWSLEKAVESVLEQEYPHIELIVIDDGSTDHTLQLLEKYDGQISVIHQANAGVSAARNNGIRNSSGELIALLDSDDAWDKRKIGCQVDFFKAHPETLICQTQEIWIRNGRQVNPAKRHLKPSGMIFIPSLYRCLVSPSAVMMRRKLFDLKGAFKEYFSVCEDYDLWLRVSHDTPVFLIDKPYTIKTGGHGDQLSRQHSQDKYRIASLQQILDSGKLDPGQTREARKVLRDKCRVYGNGCIKRGRHQEGERYLDLASQI